MICDNIVVRGFISEVKFTKDTVIFVLHLIKCLKRMSLCIGAAEYLQDVTEVLMFLLLPPGDFHNTLFRYVVRVSMLLCGMISSAYYLSLIR